MTTPTDDQHVDFFSEEDHEHLDLVLRHIENVRSACILLGKRLIAHGEATLGLSLIRHSLSHDQSKLLGNEWKYLRPSLAGTDEFKFAFAAHVESNQHHPEYWGDGIKEMNRLAIAEMVCDWYARSVEFGTDLRQWVDDVATEKYGFSKRTKTYQYIKYFLNMLLEPPFKNAKPVKKD